MLRALQLRDMGAPSLFDFVTFFPHLILMYFMPAAGAFNDDVIKPWKIALQLADAFPASLLYGAAISSISSWFAKKLRGGSKRQI